MIHTKIILGTPCDVNTTEQNHKLLYEYFQVIFHARIQNTLHILVLLAVFSNISSSL